MSFLFLAGWTFIFDVVTVFDFRSTDHVSANDKMKENAEEKM